MPLLERVLFGGMLAATAASRAAVALRTLGARPPGPPPAEGPLRVLFVAHHPLRTAGTKYRLSLWADRLCGAGHDVRLALPVRSGRAERLYHGWSPAQRAEYHVRLLLNRVGTVWRGGGFDVAVLHLSDLPHWEYGAPFVASALRRLCGRVLLDLDDLPVVRGEQEAGRKLRDLVAVVDGLIVGSEAVTGHFPGKPAWHVPTCVEPSEWPVPDRAARTGAPILGWVGTSGNLPHLEALAGVLSDVCREHGARVRVVCDRPADLPGVPVDFVPWTFDGEVADLLPLDVGLAPLDDTPITRCKCGLKALQYMAAGCPVVASPVGALGRIVEAGSSGFPANAEEEWRTALSALLARRGDRLRMGEAARASVERRWSFAAHEERFVAALRGVAVSSSGSVGGRPE